jgi:hypothetical protein
MTLTRLDITGIIQGWFFYCFSRSSDWCSMP